MALKKTVSWCRILCFCCTAQKLAIYRCNWNHTVRHFTAWSQSNWKQRERAYSFSIHIMRTYQVFDFICPAGDGLMALKNSVSDSGRSKIKSWKARGEHASGGPSHGEYTWYSVSPALYRILNRLEAALTFRVYARAFARVGFKPEMHNKSLIKIYSNKKIVDY